MNLVVAYLELAAIGGFINCLIQLIDRPCEEALISDAIQLACDCVCLPRPCTAYLLNWRVAGRIKPAVGSGKICHDADAAVTDHAKVCKHVSSLSH